MKKRTWTLIVVGVSVGWIGIAALLIKFVPAPWASAIMLAFMVAMSVDTWLRDRRSKRSLGAVGSDLLNMLREPGETDEKLAARVRAVLESAKAKAAESAAP